MFEGFIIYYNTFHSIYESPSFMTPIILRRKLNGNESISSCFYLKYWCMQILQLSDEKNDFEILYSCYPIQTKILLFFGLLVSVFLMLSQIESML